MFKKLQELGLQQAYYASSDDESKSVKALYQRTTTLAFMPTWNIDDLWCQVMDSFDHIPSFSIIVLIHGLITTVCFQENDGIIMDLMVLELTTVLKGGIIA